jgi:hypothetical protein
MVSGGVPSEAVSFVGGGSASGLVWHPVRQARRRGIRKQRMNPLVSHRYSAWPEFPEAK